MKYILFNENLVLKPDEGRTLILASLVGRNLLIGQDDSFTDIIHPIYAMILCFVDGREINECVNEEHHICQFQKNWFLILLIH